MKKLIQKVNLVNDLQCKTIFKIFYILFLGIFERIDDYSDTHRVQFPDKRLFILLPSSMRIERKLTDCSKILECAKVSQILLSSKYLQ